MQRRSKLVSGGSMSDHVLARTSRSTRQNGRRLWSLLLIAALIMTAAAPMFAERTSAGEEGPVAIGEFSLLQPISRSLGATSWMMSQGYDPRLWQVPGVSQRASVDLASFGATAAGVPRGGAAFAPPVPFRSAAPAFSRNQIVTRQLGLFPLQTEPHIASNPDDPEHLVLGVIDYNFPSMATYTSFDGGETWEGPNQVRYFQEDVTSAGDPVIAFDRQGNVYVVFISLGLQDYRLGSLASVTEISSIGIARSTSDGLAWEDAVSTARSVVTTTSRVDASGRERGELAVDFLDKPWISIGPSPDDPDKDVIYVVYTEFKTRYTTLFADELPFLTSPITETTIRLVRSEDYGMTWSDPVAVSPTVFQAEGYSEGEGEGGPSRLQSEGSERTQDDDGEGGGNTQEEGEGAGIESDQTVQGPQPVVMSDGTVAVAYLDTTLDGVQDGLYTIQVALSRDGGQSFEEPIRAGVLREIKFRPRNASFRWWGAAFPQMAVGPNDELYILTTAVPPDKPTDDGDIYLLRSLDRGLTWKDPLRLNVDDTDRIQFFPAIDVSPDGEVHAMWGDMRDDPDEVRYHIYYTRSGDQGETWGFDSPELGINTPDTRVTDFPSNSLKGFPGGRFLGDYFALTASDDDVYMVWADTRLGEFGGPNQQIGFARRTAIAPPSLFLNPPSGEAGRDVTIQGFGFQPESNITIDVGGITITNIRSNERGEFTTSIYMPVTGEGPRNVTAFDETGNVATASFYTEVGFDTIARQLEELVRGQALVPAATPSAELP
jgi:hypothetical protein